MAVNINSSATKASSSGGGGAGMTPEQEARLVSVEAILPNKADTKSVSATPVWSHPAGSSESVGDLSYLNINKTAGFFETIPTTTTFNQIKLRVWASNSTTSIEWRLYIRAGTGSFNTQTVTPSQSGVISAGGFPTAESDYTLNISDVTITAGQTVFIFFRATDLSAINHKRWAYNSTITPSRHGFALCTTSDWNQTWSLAGQTLGYGQTALQLLLEPPTLRTARIAANISYSAVSSGLSASNVQAAIDVLATLTSQPSPPEMVLPPYIYTTQGKEANVYFDNLFVGENDYLIDVVSSNGVQQNERWTTTPTSAISGTLTFTAFDRKKGLQLNTASSTIRGTASSAGSGLNKKVIYIGDSLVAAGTITQTMLDNASTDVMGLTLIGTQGTGSNKHEGRGGWAVSSYTGAGLTYYSFTVTGVVTPPSINATEYTHNGSTYRVQQVNLSGGSGTIICSVLSGGAPLSTGTLTKSNAVSGDSAIVFTASSSVPANPFWINSAINFPQYLANNSFSTPDWVFIQLGINDVFSYTTDASVSTFADSQFTNLDTLINSIKASGVNVKVGVVIPPPPAYNQDAFGANYASANTRWRHKRNILIWTRQLISKYQNQEGNRVYIVPANTAIDTVNNYSTTTANINARNATQVSRQSNGVHPATAGYQQIGDAVWAFLKYFA